MHDDIVSSSMAQFGLPLPKASIPLTGGANNRVYKLSFEDRDPLVLKRYFQHPQDLRPRLQSEIAFLQYAWNIGLKCIPQPLYSNLETHVAITSFLSGQPPEAKDLKESLLQQVIDFFLTVNRFKKQATHLPLASEACFTLHEHLRTIEDRIQLLLSVEALESFLRHQLLPAWERVKKHIEKIPDVPLLLEHRCVSPSDFGLHNALLEKERLTLIDFEYAGWDDPAKTVCDFFCQPRIPIPLSFFNQVCDSFLSFCPDPNTMRARIHVLMPAYRIKWCCILLNQFSPVGQSRRTFALSKEMKDQQLQNAKQQLAQIEALSWHT